MKIIGQFVSYSLELIPKNNFLSHKFNFGIQIKKRELINLFSFITSHCFDAGITEGGNLKYATS
jgi:hypothetical protein